VLVMPASWQLSLLNRKFRLCLKNSANVASHPFFE
jgi:hypothetical protein